ncbi:MAG TPA: hypothetical protein VF155_07765 [Candidatus Dormibacteraeota bacterium]
MSFAVQLKIALFLSVISVLIAYLTTSHNAAAFFGLLSWPIAVGVATAIYLIRNLAGWGSQWRAAYERHPLFQSEQPRLYLVPKGGRDVLFPYGLRCEVRERGGLLAWCERNDAANGFRYPGEFPEHVPPVPGRHRAVWLERFVPGGRWWKLVALDFDYAVPDEGATP